MLFNGISFDFGKVQVSISSVDTEKATGYIEIKIPISNQEISINIKRWFSWAGGAQINLHCDIREIVPEPVYHAQDDESEDDEDHEEEST